MPATPRTPSAEDDLAFLRTVVSGGGKPSLTLAVAYLAGGLLYGIQCLFHVAQSRGLVNWPGPVVLTFLIGVTVAFIGILIWATRKDHKDGVGTTKGPVMTRALNAAFSGCGMANLAVIIIFGLGSARDHDFATWLYYPAVIFTLQGAAWYVAFAIKRKPWMLATSLGGWATAVTLGLLVRQVDLYLLVCTAAMFLLFALPGWIMFRDARSASGTA